MMIPDRTYVADGGKPSNASQVRCGAFSGFFLSVFKHLRLGRPLAAALAFSGCVVLQDSGPLMAQPGAAVPAQQQALRAARQACNAQYPEQIGSYVLHARCVDEAINRLWLRDVRDPDLVRLQQAARMALSARVDRHEVAAEEAALQMAEVDSRVAEVAHQRAIDNRAAAAQSLAAFRGWLSATQMPRNIRCFKTGAITNCTTN